jgi:NhaC family Na+:H+ antiporter
MAGTIPTLVYYGIQVVRPDWFYPAAFIVCAGISLGIGSSWTTAGTIGVGLVGLALMTGVSPVIVAGAVVSGAYVGEKLSPLSETAILAAQLTGSTIGAHLRAQAWTSVPSLLFALVGFVILGHLAGEGAPQALIASELSALSQLFVIAPWTLLPLVLLIMLSVLRVPSSLAIACSALFAALLAPFLQAEATLRFIAAPELPPVLAFVKAGWQAMATGYQANSGIAVVDSLLSRGGMDSMLLTIWLILGALVFGTLLDEFGLLLKLVDPILARAQNTGSLIGGVVATAVGLNLAAGDQYVAIVLPARIFKTEFKKRGLASTNLSRAVAEGGSVTSPLVPWNSCGAYMAAVLGVPTLLYLPFCLFNLASVAFTLILGFTGLGIARAAAVNTADEPAQ